MAQSSANRSLGIHAKINEAFLRVYRWPVEETQPFKAIENRYYAYPVVREIRLEAGSSLLWSPDVPPGKYVVIIKTLYERDGIREMAEQAYPLEFQ